MQVVQSILIDDPFGSVHLQEIEIFTESLEEIRQEIVSRNVPP